MSAVILAEARKLQDLGFACAGVCVTAGPKGKRLSAFPQGWQKSKPETCMDYFSESHNGLILCTGEHSDILALDVDVPKPDDLAAGRLDGLKVIESLIDQHGLPAHVPVQQTGSGGQHLLFSLSGSLQEGLNNSKNQTKLRVDGKETTIDIRGDNGEICAYVFIIIIVIAIMSHTQMAAGCLVVAPTAYTTADDQLHEYKWLTRPGHRSDLKPLPPWLINIINSADKRGAQQTAPYPNKKRAVADPTCAYQALTTAAVEKVVLGGIGKTWPRPNGYDFAPVERECPCGLCRQLHSSNNYIVRRIISTCFYLSNYSSKCHTTKVCGADEVIALRNLLAAPTSDDRVVKVLQLVTRDVGQELRYTGKQWLCFQGLIWEPLTDLEIKKRIKTDVNYDVLETLIKIIKCKDNRHIHDEATSKMIAGLEKANKFLEKASNVSSVAETAKQLLLDVDIAKQLDTNPDILACLGGVIELQTGKLRKSSSFDHLSRNVQADYLGLDAPTPIIDSFFNSIFNDNPEVINYMQRLLGYAITGHTSSQKMALFIGAGSNGKSLLLGLLSKLLGPTMYCTPAREVFFESGRPTAAGGHTAHLAPLASKLICAREELNKSDRLDVASIKLMTGEGDIVSRAPYASEYHTFKPTHLPILACNHLPPIDVDDDAVLRRLVVVPFMNVYLSNEDRVPFDPSNPHHRPKDPQLKDKLSTPEAQSQLLTWLVKGAVQWYERRLQDVPDLLRARLEAYIADNDVLDQFIEDECEIGADFSVNAAQFRGRFEDRGCKIAQKLLKPKMAKRGLMLKVIRHKTTKVLEQVYLGVRFKQL